jgi:hypothetical protein
LRCFDASGAFFKFFFIASLFAHFVPFLATDSNSNGSYYYSNDNGSTYYNSGSGYSRYTSSSGNVRESK